MSAPRTSLQSLPATDMGPCLRNEPEMCPLFREGIITAPTDWSRDNGRGDEALSARDEEVEEMFSRMQRLLPFGSTALLRVDPDSYAGQDVVPVLIGRKEPRPWSSAFSRDGMFAPGNTMVWIHDIHRVTGGEDGVEYEVPDRLLGDDKRAVPLTSFAGLGRSLAEYMELGPVQNATGSTKRYRLRAGVMEDARSTLVLMSTNPKVSFMTSQLALLGDDDCRRCPVNFNLFEVGTNILKGFKAPAMGSGRKPAWSGGQKKQEAVVVDIATCRESRRHRYQLNCRGEQRIMILAGLPSDVDEGYVEQFVVNP